MNNINTTTLEEKIEYYVWFDTFLEEHFVLEADEFKKNPGLQKQLSLEKINFMPIEAENRKEAVLTYKKSHPLAGLVIPPNSLIPDFEDSVEPPNTTTPSIPKYKIH